MITCLEFRRRAGAEPWSLDAAIEAHRRECPACARHQDELRAMDGLIKRALAIDPALPAGDPAAAPQGGSRRRLLAIAASVVMGVAVGIALLVSLPRVSIAREVMDHVIHERSAMDTTAPIAPTAVAAVLDPDGTRLRPDVGDVTFAARCIFDGRVVPHLVVRTASGPVTVLMLRHRTISKPLHIDEQGYEGVVLPAPRGSIAVVGRDIADLDGVARKVFDAVDWAP